MNPSKCLILWCNVIKKQQRSTTIAYTMRRVTKIKIWVISSYYFECVTYVPNLFEVILVYPKQLTCSFCAYCHVSGQVMDYWFTESRTNVQSDNGLEETRKDIIHYLMHRVKINVIFYFTHRYNSFMSWFIKYIVGYIQ